MKPRKQSAAAKIRKLRPRIERELQHRMSRNAIRKKLISEGAIDLTSTAHFNNIISDFNLERSTSEAGPDDHRTIYVPATNSEGSGQATPAGAPYSPPSAKAQAAGKPYFDTPSADERFVAEMSGGVK
ncbi:MAG: hypothetical protein K5799_04090 [Erythrobacter sp.]|nr:hypothetical protein [Erythrobacter sp.]